MVFGGGPQGVKHPERRIDKSGKRSVSKSKPLPVTTDGQAIKTSTHKSDDLFKIHSPIRVLLSGLFLSFLFVALALSIVISNEKIRQNAALEATTQMMRSIALATEGELSRVTSLTATLIRDNKSKKAKGSRVISRGIFNSQIKPILAAHPYISSAVFMPKIVSAEEALFEAASHAKGLSQYHSPKTLTGSGNKAPLYFPVRFVEWQSGPKEVDRFPVLSLFPKSVIAGEEALATIVNVIERGGIWASELFIHPQQSKEFGSLSREQAGNETLGGLTNHSFWLMSAVRTEPKSIGLEQASYPKSVKSVIGIFGLEISLNQLIDTTALSPGVVVDIVRNGNSSAVLERFEAKEHWGAELLSFAGLVPLMVEHPLGFPGQNLSAEITINPHITSLQNELLLFVLGTGVFAVGLSIFLAMRRARINRTYRLDRIEFESRVENSTRRLAANNTKLRHLIESTNVVAWAADLEGQSFSYIGPQIESLSGILQSTWYSHNFWYHHIHPDDRSRVLKDLDKLVPGSFTVREYRLRHSDGSVIWVRNSITVTAVDNTKSTDETQNEVGGLQGFFIDITDQKRAQATSQRAIELAEQANRTKSDFLANMSHELRTPLNSIIGFAEIMDGELFGPLGNDRYCDYAKNIHVSGRHLLELINDILDLSKIESGRFELQEVEVDLLALLRSCYTSLKDKAKDAGVHFSLSADTSLPDFYGDGRRTKQILINLLSNAIKFTKPGGSVALEARVVTGKGLFLSVQDTGIGIDSKDIALAMEKFSQINSSLTRQHYGSGLGLPIAKSLAEIHGGQLLLKSKVGQGTTVTIWMPEERVLNDNELFKNPQSIDPVSEDDHPKLRVA